MTDAWSFAAYRRGPGWIAHFTMPDGDSVRSIFLRQTFGTRESALLAAAGAMTSEKNRQARPLARGAVTRVRHQGGVRILERG